jgi:CRP/FNR family cyclic AMP-dependent transcriptional regulator
MISPELLRRYPFFSSLNDAQQREIATAAEEVVCERGATLFEEGQPVQSLHFLLEGSVDLYYAAGDGPHDRFLVCEIGPGEPFGISALIEPYTLTATARAAAPSRILKIDAARLRALCEADCRMGHALMRRVAQVAMERLHYTRLQLAAARV